MQSLGLMKNVVIESTADGEIGNIGENSLTEMGLFVRNCTEIDWSGDK